MAIATGIAKKLKYKDEGATWGVVPAAASSQSLRRVTSDIDLEKETYQSNEIRDDYQVSDFRHGVRSVSGTIQGELSAGTYKDFFAAATRQAWQAQVTTGSLVNLCTITTVSGMTAIIVRSSGSFITDGFKIGMVITATGFTTSSNNSHNMLITALTATNMSIATLDGVAPVAQATAVTTNTIVTAGTGKFTSVPLTAHTDKSFSIEHYYSDLTLSEVFSGCKVSQIDVNMPATGMATVSVGFTGKDITTAGAEYFTSPTAQTTTGIMAGVNGALYLNGTAVANITGMNLAINGNMNAEAVLGSNTRPDIFEGRVMVSGQMTVFFESATMRDLFINETEAALTVVLTSANTPTADIIGFTMPRIKTGGAKKDDGEKGLVQTIPFTALLNTAGGTATTLSTLKTTLTIQDSTA